VIYTIKKDMVSSTEHIKFFDIYKEDEKTYSHISINMEKREAMTGSEHHIARRFRDQIQRELDGKTS